MAVKRKQQKKNKKRSIKINWEERSFEAINFKTREGIYADGRREKIPAHVDLNKVYAKAEEIDE